MEIKKLGIGIIGLGVISDIHIKALKNIENAKITAVCTRDSEKAMKKAEELRCKAYTDYHELAVDKSVDAVILCTPSGSRLEMAEYIAEQKKHIISEKPLEVTTERIDIMLNACKKNGVYIASIFHKRYHPVYKYIKNMIDSGRLGEIVTTDVLMKWYRPDEYYNNSSWRGTMALDGGGALMNQCVHFIDMVQWFNGGMKSVFAKTGQKIHKGIETEDTAVAVVEYSNGAFGVIEATTSSYPGFSTLITVNGSKGGIICENEKIREMKLSDETEEDRKMLSVSELGEHGGDAKTNVKQDFSLHLEQLQKIVDAILKGKQPPVDGKEARKAVEIITGMYESAKSRKEIIITGN
ncbi:MAG: Gfo/Idh/MocA family oxidoreductase [Clostridiales bacterium]|nr:Gfo/Idh/MocA family oxidoreductase [Clostridiales bacterium]